MLGAFKTSRTLKRNQKSKPPLYIGKPPPGRNPSQALSRKAVESATPFPHRRSHNAGARKDPQKQQAPGRGPPQARSREAAESATLPHVRIRPCRPCDGREVTLPTAPHLPKSFFKDQCGRMETFSIGHQWRCCAFWPESKAPGLVQVYSVDAPAGPK